MILSRRVKFHGVQLDSLAPEIVITGVDLGSTKENISAVDRLAGFGQRITGAHWQTLEASVVFGINVPKNRLGRRLEIWEAIANWAANRTGWLSISFDGRSVTAGGGTDNGQPKGKRMYVDKVIMPSTGDFYEWTKEYTITFRAYNVPFWQDENESVWKSGTTTGSTMYVTVPGRIRTPLNIEFQNMSGKTINNFRVWTGESGITLTDFSLGGSETLKISHGNDGLMSIKKGGTSVYKYYTGSDDLLIGPGSSYVAFDTERAGILTASVFGRYV